MEKQNKNRAEHGKQIIKELSRELTNKYGKGFSPANLANFKQFYLVFKKKGEIIYPLGGEIR